MRSGRSTGCAPPCRWSPSAGRACGRRKQKKRRGIMRKADFRARVKKIEIVNRVLTDGWAQSIRVTLEDIELTNENLLEIKQFRPNEQVLVELTPMQVSLFDVDNRQHSAGALGQ